MSTQSKSLTEAWVGAAPLGRVAAPLREQVIDALRTAILHFQLRPGQRLIERELIETLGVSRTTVREALRELTSEGLVTIVPQKGAIVTAPTAEDALDLYTARAALESVLVQRFTENATGSQQLQLAATVEEFAEAAEAGNELGLLAAKDRFNAVLAEGARSPVLTQLAESLQARLRVLRVMAMTPSNHAEATAELRAILQAIQSKDADAAARLYTAHINRSAETALGELRATVLAAQ